jgi:hypothetical protein
MIRKLLRNPGFSFNLIIALVFLVLSIILVMVGWLVSVLVRLPGWD